MEPIRRNKRPIAQTLAIFFSFNMLLGNFALAEQTEETADPLLNDLLQELEQVTQIATHTKLNVDFVPGMVSVLHSEDLLSRGLLTVPEALATVPGIEISVANDGQTNYVMRGIGKSFSSGKVKMLINGRAQNAAMSAASTATLFPVALIDRIEVIRGPGSAIYGEYAYAGVINIILRKDNQVFATERQLNEHTAGISLSNYSVTSPFKYALNMAVYDKKGDDVKAGNDFLKDFPNPNFSAISNAPGPSNEAERNFTSSLLINYKNINWDSSLMYQNVGDYFGLANALPSEVKPVRTVITMTSDLDITHGLSKSLEMTATLGSRFYALRSDLHEFFPVNFPDMANSSTFADGVLGSPNYTEYEGRGNLEFNFSGIENHDILFGLHGALVLQGDTWARRNHNILPNGTPTEVPVQDFRGDQNWLTENNKRIIASLYAQDQWNIWKPFTLTIGGRVDNYPDIGTSFNPRIAGVYNFLDNHIFKVQYARAFRPPTFIEMFARNNTIAIGNSDIKAETIDSLEAGYIYNTVNTMLRATAFYTQMDNLITNDDITGKYQNLEGVKTEGGEIEVKQKLLHNLSFSANATYLRVRDTESNKPLPNIANILGNAGIAYSPVSGLALSLTGQYIGTRTREDSDARPSMPATQVLNSTIDIHNLGIKNLSAHIGVSNLLDQDIRHPAPLVSFANQDIPSYKDDYPRAGREYWLHLSYEL